MKKRIAKLIPAAIDAVDQVFPANSRPIPREYQGYISSFGASVMQSGILPTLTIYASQQQRGNATEDRSKILSVLQHILLSDHSSLPNGIKETIRGKDLFKAAVELYKDDLGLRDLRGHLLDAAVAAKLAIRTFELTPNA
jgi:CRISPR-associated protein Cmr5